VVLVISSVQRLTNFVIVRLARFGGRHQLAPTPIFLLAFRGRRAPVLPGSCAVHTYSFAQRQPKLAQCEEFCHGFATVVREPNRLALKVQTVSGYLLPTQFLTAEADRADMAALHPERIMDETCEISKAAMAAVPPWRDFVPNCFRRQMIEGLDEVVGKESVFSKPFLRCSSRCSSGRLKAGALT